MKKKGKQPRHPSKSVVGKKAGEQLISRVHIDSVIHTIRREKVILDADLARIYGVSTKALNQAVKRNVDRFCQRRRFVTTRFSDSTNKGGVDNFEVTMCDLKRKTGRTPILACCLH